MKQSNGTESGHNYPHQKLTIGDLTHSANGNGGGRFVVNAPTTDRHQVFITYCNGWDEAREATLLVDGASLETVSFPSTGSWNHRETVALDLLLVAGVNHLSFVSLNNSGPEIAGIVLREELASRGLDYTLGASMIAAVNLASIGALALTADRSGIPNDVGDHDRGKASGADNDMLGTVGDESSTFEGTRASNPPVGTAMANGNSNAGAPAPGSADEQVPEGEEEHVGSSGRLFEQGASSSGSESAGPETRAAVSNGPAMPNALGGPTGSGNDASATSELPENGKEAVINEIVEPGPDDQAVPRFTQGALRMQAEDAVIGTTGAGVTTNPTVVSTSTATGSDLANADAADNDSYVDFSGLNGDFNAGSGEYVEWTFNVDQAGYYDLAVGYAFYSASASNRPMRMDVNGALWDRVFDLANTGSNTSYDEAITRVYLTAGENTVRMTSNGSSGPNVDYLEIRDPDPNVFVFQGEDLAPELSKLQNTNALTNRSISADTIPDNEQFRVGAEGGSYLDWAVGSGADIEAARAAVADFTFTASTAGTYAITLTYATSAARPLDLKLVDGTTVTLLDTFQIAPSLAPTRLPTDRAELLGVGDNHDNLNEINNATPSAWEGWAQETITVTLAAGENTLRLQLPPTGLATGPNIDKIVVALVESGEPPVDENTAPTAQAVTVVTDEDSSVIVDLTAHIDDVDGDALTISAVTSGDGNVTINGKQITFQPNANFSGPATITFTVSDPEGATATNTITVDVAAVNDAPAISGTIGDQTIPAGGGTIDLISLVISDVDGDAVTYGLRATTGELPDGITLNGNQIVVGPGVAAGAYAVEIFASDGTLESESVPLTLTVESSGSEPGTFTPMVIQGETFAAIPDGDAVATNDTLIRTQTQNQERAGVNNPGGQANPGLPEFDEHGLRPGYSGDGYLDINGTGTGVRATFELDVPPGEYVVHVRVANGATGTGNGFNRPIGVAVDGVQQGEAQNTNTGGFFNWQVLAFTVTLEGDGPYSIGIVQATTGQAPNIDAVAITEVGGEPSFFMPVITSATAVSVLEGAAAAFDVDATDADGNTLIYSLTGEGADDALFTIDPVTGALSFVSAADFENAADSDGDNVYQVEVAVSDGWSIVRQSIAVTVTDDPGDNAPADLTADEGGDLALTVIDLSDPANATFAVSGLDADIVSLTVSVGGNAPVSVTVTDGQFALDLGMPEPGSIEIILSVEDGAGNIASATTTATIGSENSVPEISSESGFSVSENSTIIGAITATDDNGDTLSYALSGADAGLLSIDENGVISLNAAADFENPADADGDGVLNATVTVSDGTASVTQYISITITNENEAPELITLTGDPSFAENAAGGTVIGVVSASDPDAGDTISFTTSDARFLINGAGQLVVADGAVFDFDAEPAIDIIVTASDGALATQTSFTLNVEEVAAPAGPTGLVFNASTLTSYSTQDVGTGASVSEDGATLNLGGNLWKRAPLGDSYTITEGTKLVLTVTLGTSLSEIVAVGFDDDNSPFEMSDRSVYQIAGSESQSAFVDLRGGNNGVPGTTFTVTIDLAAHVGKTISSLVFIADDDASGNGIGSASFSNVQLIEGDVDPDINNAPDVIGGGIADLVLPERDNIEIDMPFIDSDGDALSYALSVTDALGNPVSGFENLVFEQGTLKGQLQAAPSATPYIVTITADDGNGGVTSTTFELTIEDVHDAPVLNDGVAFEPYSGSVGQEIEGIDLALFADAFSDPDGDQLILSVEGLPAGLSLNAEGVIVGTPLEAGDGTITIVATDPTGLRAEFELEFNIVGPAVGDVTVVQAEDFTGLAEATGFYAAAAPGASGNQVIRTNANQSGSVTTNLAANGLGEGWYEVAITVYDETDGTATFSLSIGDIVLADGLTFDDNGTFDNPGQARGNGGQVGNLKTITFTTPVFIDATTLATLAGVSDSGEHLRIDKLSFTRVDAPDLPPANIALDNAAIDENAAGAVIGLLSATDPDGNAGAITYATTDPRFVIVGNELRLADGISLDHEAGEAVTVSITATDANGLATTSELTITVNDVNEAPTLGENAAIADISLVEGTGQTIDIGAALGATDPDEGAALSYIVQLSGGTPLPDGMVITNGVLEIGVGVPVGTYEIVAFVNDGALDSESVSFTVTVSEEGEQPPFEPLTIQAEEGVITLLDNGSNATVTTIRDPSNPESNPDLPTGLRPDFSGTGYIDFGDTAGDKASYSLTVAEAGTYVFNIRYASNTDRPLDFAVNDGGVISLPFVTTDPDGTGTAEGFDNWLFQTVTVELEAGANTFSFAIPAGANTGPNIDRIDVTQPVLNDVSADEDEIPLFLSGPQGELNETEAASINFNVAGVDNDIVKVEVSFDGGLTRVEVFPDADGDFTVDGSALAAGDQVATIIVTDEVGNEAETAMDFVIAGEPATVQPFTIQAEDTSKVTVDDTGTGDTDTSLTREVNAGRVDAFGNYRDGAVGDAYVDFGTNAGDGIIFNVDAPAAGTYMVTFRYANGGAENRPLNLVLNDGTPVSVDFVPGPVVGTGSTATGWASWVEQTVEVTLTEGANTIRLEIPAGAVNGPNIDQATFEYLDGSVDPESPFLAVIEAESFSVSDVEANSATPADTVARTPDNKEPGSNAGNSGPGQIYDADGLRPGYEGEGYMDFGNDVGDMASFTLDVPTAGTYQLTIRYANGGATDRPMTISIGGVEQTVDFVTTTPAGGDVNSGWSNWVDLTIDIELEAGSNTVSFVNQITNGPNIDNVTISRDGDVDPVDPRTLVRFEEVVKINFEPAPGQGTQGLPAGYTTPDGYLADTGSAFGDRGNGFTYGWVTEASVADGTANGTVAADQPANAHWYKNIASGASDLQKTYAHFEYPGGGANNARAWEMALEDGTYQITMSVGDTAGAFDSNYVINVEGQNFMPDWVPANPVDGSQNGGGFRSTLVTGIVTVTDGRLTIDSIGGTNTEIQHLEIERIPDLTPDDGWTADLDYSFFTAPVAASLEDGQVSIAIGPNGELPTDIDPTSSLVVGVNIQADGNRGPNIAHVENIKLVETLTGIEVAIDVQISGGADSLTIRPLEQLKENTSYTLKVQDVMDLGSITDPNGELRQFQDLTTTFVTGEAPIDVPREVAFTTDTLLNGFSDGAFGYTSVEFGPDGKLYVATITGEVHRWNVNADGTIDKASQETLSLDYLDAGGGERRGIVGFAFDPEDPNTIWITDNAPIPRESKAFQTPEFSGRISKITLGEGGAFEDATAETYVTGLPRSGGDHLTNSLEFRANPNAGEPGEPDHLLYLSQGSNSAAGAADGAWGNRPERLLNAAILEIDPTRDAPEGGFDVRTEPIDPGDAPTSSFPAGQFNEDGTYPGMYNPFADDAVLKIYATGVRNAYDLVWHSNGNLYVPTNGTASGGKTPTDPTQPGLDTTIGNSPKQYDYFFTVEEGGYYGHPNVLRDEYVLNGGNPTSGQDPNEVVGGNDGNPNTDGYQTGVQVDENYDYDGVYNLGYNQSPNGATEYTGDAFGSNLKGAILFAQFSTGDNVRVIRVDAQGNIIGDDVLRRPDGSVIDDYIDPLDIIQNPVTGQLYLMTLNRGTGASQLILLTPAPGGVTEDLTADVGGNLALVAVDVSDPSQAMFQVNGLDDDITAIRIQFNDGPKTTIVLDGQGRFVIDLGSLDGPVTATLEVTDDALNVATANVEFTPGEEPVGPDYVTLVTIQAEDKTPGDGTAVAVATGSNAQIQIRDASNLETGTGAGYVNGLRPGAVGLDGNTDNLDGTPGGYADFGSTNADFVSFTFDVPSDNAGTAILRFRYSNGGATDRPLQLEVNGSIVNVQSFLPTGSTDVDGWTIWAEIEVPVSLVAGQNTVTLRSTEATGPNIDQLEVLVQEATETTPNDGEVVIDGVTYVVYEAENADFGGAAIVTEERNQSGDAFVDFVGTADQSISWTVSVGEPGTYSLDFLYALATTKTARPMTLTINGVTVETLAFDPNSNAGETTWGPQSATVDLQSGVNTITITAPNGNGPNVDVLRITKEPISVFEPDFADIAGSGRIELEAGDGSANTVNGSVVDFYFTVDADGIYKLDTAANANATNGQGLTWFINGVAIDDSNFPGIGDAGEESVYAELQAGTQYQIRIVSDAPGADGLDYLDIGPAPGNANADIEVQSLDAAYLGDRLHFSYIENPDAVNPDAPDRDFKDSGTVRISNSGTEVLEILEAEIDGPFVLANPGIFDGLTIAAGGFIDVEVLFDRTQYTPPTSNVDGTSTIFTGELKLRTNDADSPIATVDLAGFWQARDEGGQEPNVNEIWQIFGFGNRIEGLKLTGGGEDSTLSTNDVFAKTDDTEVLSPYWKIADGYSAAKITQIAAFHGTGGATMGIHNPNNKSAATTFWNHEGTDNQRLLPNSGNDTSFSTRTFTANDIPEGWVGNDVFGITVAGLSTDPRLNPTGSVIVPGAQQGHTVKVFQALDVNGNVIPNVYLGIMDYTGINYDYNDNLFVIEGVEPVGFGQDISVEGLDDAAADDRLVFTNIDDPANAQQNFRNEATFTISNDGFAPLSIEGIIIGDPQSFEIVGTIPTSIAAGGSVQITVRFIGTHAGTGAGAQLYNSTLTIISDDASEGTKVIQLAGLAQEFSERGSEPTVAQIVEAFGYGTDMAQGELAGGGVVETIGDEVLMPYMQKLDGSRSVEVIQLAAFLQQNNVARLGFHGLGSSDVTNLFAQDDQEYQTVLPSSHVAGAGVGAGVARNTIDQSGPFGLFISVDGRPTYASWSDPEANKIDPDFGHLVGNNQGHLIRFFQALDADGNAIEGTYIAIQDYPGAGNYDYNDHMFIIKNVKPYDLTLSDDGNADGVNDALQDDADNDGTVDFFDPDTDPVDPEEPGEGSRGDFVLGINFGGGAIANDPILGVPLVAQSDPRVTLSGSINPGIGIDEESNPNGANATAGSAFKTYEDGSDWTATIDVPNGTYVVVLHTQETYWNSAGQRQFDISINGQQVVSNLDPFVQAGGDKPIAIEAVVTITNGQIVIDLSADIDNATLNAVTIYEYVEPGSGQEAVNGTPFLVDADGISIDALDYDEGGQGIAYNDASGLQGGTNGGRAGSHVEVTGAGDIGWIASGEWLEYTVDIANAGEYDLGLLLANGGGVGRTATVSFYRAGEDTPYATSGPIDNPQTPGWSTFLNRTVEGIELEAGEQVVRVSFSGGSQDFRSFSLTPVVTQTPFGGMAPTFNDGSLTVDATNFDEGGQGVAYSDNAGLDNTGNGVRPGRDVEFVGPENDIGHVLPGEWVEYTIEVPSAGTYSFSVNAKTPVSGATVAVSLAGGIELGVVELADGHAGGSNFSSAAFAESETISIQLDAGLQTLRLTLDGPLAANGYVLDLRSFSLEAQNAQALFASDTTDLLFPASGDEEPVMESSPPVDDSNAEDGLGHIFGYDMLT
ncbi:MAG: carbohydrate-binding protein [Phyllobacterium sp.]